MACIHETMWWGKPQFLLQQCRPPFDKWSANRMGGRIVIPDYFIERLLPDISQAYALADLDVAERIHVQPRGVFQIFVGAGGKLPPVPGIGIPAQHGRISGTWAQLTS